MHTCPSVRCDLANTLCVCLRPCVRARGKRAAVYYVQMETKDLISGSELMEKSLRSAIAESGAAPSSGVTVEGESLLSLNKIPDDFHASSTTNVFQERK